MNDVYYRNPKIYLICGKARNGKDTFAGYVKDSYINNGKSAIITSIAKYIKYYAMEMTGWNLDDETKPRELLQKLGTDVIRKKLNKETFFINRVIDDIEIFSYFYDAIIIADCRFSLEIEMIKRAYPNTRVIHIERPNFDNGLTTEQKNHPTETGLDDFDDYDYKIINTTLDKLNADALGIYEKEK